MTDEFLLLAHAVATLGMTGVIWFVQLVHYPLFRHVGSAGFPEYAAQYLRRTTWVVAPLMLLEAVTAAWLLLSTDGVTAHLCQIGILLLAGIWLSTFFVQVPCHARLERGFDAAVARRLVRGNWIRTAAWSGRAVVAVWLLLAAGG